MAGIAIGPDAGERLQRGPRNHRMLCELPALEVIELHFGPDFEGVDVHTHSDHTDCFHVLEGEAEFSLDGQQMRAGPGSFVAAPPGVRHGFRNAAGGEPRLLNVHAPTVGFADGLRGSLGR